MTALATPVADRPADHVRQHVVGADFHVCTYDSVLRWLRQAAPRAREESTARYLSAANVADVMNARRDPSFDQALNSSDLTVPDGMPVVWALRTMGHPILDRVYGPDMMAKALTDETIAARRHVLIAGQPDAREGVRSRFPGVNWVGDLDFFYDDLDDRAIAELADRYKQLDTDYAWVSLGGGKQVRFMHRFAPLVDRGVLLGVGAAFDFHAGLIPSPPGWVQRNGFEWLYRLLSEPRRLWRRYLLHNPPFLYHWLSEAALRRAPAPVISTPVAPAPHAERRVETEERLDSRRPRSAWRPSLSVVAPMHNEAECVDGLFDSLARLERLMGAEYDLEFVLVDDGSTDNTGGLVTSAIGDRPHYRLIRHNRNRGVAAAIFTGIREARGEIVASIDSDGSYDLSILQAMAPMTSADTPIVTASPYHRLGGVEGVPGWRVSLSRAASRVYALAMPQKIACYTACFRTYYRESVLNCEPQNDGFTGVTELAWKVMRGGGEVAEYPAVLRPRTAGVSKMRVARTMAAHAGLLSRIAAASATDRVLGRRRRVHRRTNESA